MTDQSETADRTSMKRLGKAIELRRVELDLKRRELAERAGLSYPYVSEIENGNKNPSTSALSSIARALELESASDLWARADRGESSDSNLFRLTELLSELTAREPDVSLATLEAWTRERLEDNRPETSDLLRSLSADAADRWRGLGDDELAELSSKASWAASAERGVSNPGEPDASLSLGPSGEARFQEQVATIVRAELRAWARTELPAIIQREVATALESARAD